ncbi:hypothetical protein Csa_020115 [Cucumis sativus]|uniref:Uncharacterized protein n=1 Tax=Cucumis sativus TaxID=3659 RepID=A0A0A0LWR0_CUCSA|nr:hypothetical protein Csa_020115 [Cucumis sativus]
MIYSGDEHDDRLMNMEVVPVMVVVDEVKQIRLSNVDVIVSNLHQSFLEMSFFKGLIPFGCNKSRS